MVCLTLARRFGLLLLQAALRFLPHASCALIPLLVAAAFVMSYSDRSQSEHVRDCGRMRATRVKLLCMNACNLSGPLVLPNMPD